jgi:hypothetical protein
MRVIIPGHFYELDHLDGEGKQKLQFVDRNHDRDTQGTYNQEVLRALIDRVQFLHGEKPWRLNEQIIYHLRMALILHEARVLFRKVEKGKLRPETLVTGNDGHIVFLGGEN